MLVTANIFQPLIDVFAAVIKFFHGNVGLSWGWSIVLLTVCVRLVLVPLTVKQFSSMRKLQHLQPQMKEIQRKYKDDKQRQQEEMMKFYRENEVNPLASCLPLVAQLPVFVSLFYMLRKNLRTDICPTIQRAFQQHYAAVHHVPMKEALSQTTQCVGPGHEHVAGAGFLFINDITNQAHGVTLVVLLILYVGTQVMSTFLMSAPTMDKSQRNMMMVMPVVFVLFIIRFPAGLIVYWITTNAWTMAQQFALKQLMGHPPVPALPGAAGDGTSGGGGSSGGGAGSPRSGGGKGPRSGGGQGGGKAAVIDVQEGGSSGGLGGLRKRFAQVKEDAQAEAEKQAEARRAAAPPPRPPRKKRKRSGRRR